MEVTYIVVILGKINNAKYCEIVIKSNTVQILQHLDTVFPLCFIVNPYEIM